MLRSLMQIYVKGSVEAVKLYKEAFNAEILGLYPDDNGGYMHSELNAYKLFIATRIQEILFCVMTIGVFLISTLVKEILGFLTHAMRLQQYYLKVLRQIIQIS